MRNGLNGTATANEYYADENLYTNNFLNLNSKYVITAKKYRAYVERQIKKIFTNVQANSLNKAFKESSARELVNYIGKLNGAISYATEKFVVAKLYETNIKIPTLQDYEDAKTSYANYVKYWQTSWQVRLENVNKNTDVNNEVQMFMNKYDWTIQNMYWKINQYEFMKGFIMPTDSTGGNSGSGTTKSSLIADEQTFIEKNKTALMVGGGLVVAYLIFK